MKELTKAEEQVMKSLWKIKKGYLKEIIEQFPSPRPAYTTIATVIGVLVKKEIVGFKQNGNNREYFPLVKKEIYFARHIKQIIGNFFNNSAPQFASFFANETDLSLEELEEMKTLIDDKIKSYKQNG
jgi:BlaI family penicillinase repressor